jgi:hypothetical protein
MFKLEKLLKCHVDVHVAGTFVAAAAAAAVVAV